MSATLRRAVSKRANARCEYCQLPDLVPHLIRFQLEHIRARRHGGSSSLNNLAWACPDATNARARICRPLTRTQIVSCVCSIRDVTLGQGTSSGRGCASGASPRLAAPRRGCWILIPTSVLNFARACESLACSEDWPDGPIGSNVQAFRESARRQAHRASR